jgi:plasmid stability protein
VAQIIVRNLDDSTVAELKAQARAAGRSLEAEVRLLLEGHAARRERRAKALAEVDAIRNSLAGTVQTDSAILRHEGRR